MALFQTTLLNLLHLLLEAVPLFLLGETGDRLFVIFAAAFGLLMVERLMLATVSTSHELAPYIYVVRLFAFILIMGAVVDKNRRR